MAGSGDNVFSKYEDNSASTSGLNDIFEKQIAEIQIYTWEREMLCEFVKAKLKKRAKLSTH